MNSITFSEERDEEASYSYCDDYQPHAVRHIFDEENMTHCDLRWDPAGNLGQISVSLKGNVFDHGRFLFWTVDNRMHAAVDDKHYSYYTYDYTGERRLKLTGESNRLDVNADFMTTGTLLNTPTLYPSAYLVLTSKGYTKHYYAGADRVAASLGGGGLKAVGSNPEMQERANWLFGESHDRVNGRMLQETGQALPAWEYYGFIKDIPGRMNASVEFKLDDFHKNLEMLAEEQHDEKDVYFYHSDHLGSASWITDGSGIPVQHLQYLPFGEPFVDQHPAGYQERFRFTGKERDEETGYGYFGARYMDHELTAMWLSVDPMADKYPSISPYAYCAWNPVKLVDPDGRDIWILTDNYTRVKWTKNGLFNEDGSKYEGSNSFVEQTALSLNAIYEDNQMLLSQFMGDSEYDVVISETSGATEYHESAGGTEKYGFSLKKEQPIVFNPTMGLSQCKGDSDNEEYLAPFLCLLHEFGHTYNAVTDYNGYIDRMKTKTGDAYNNREELFVIQNYEQPAAAKHGMLQRTSHRIHYDGLSTITTEGPLSSKPIRK